MNKLMSKQDDVLDYVCENVESAIRGDTNLTAQTEWSNGVYVSVVRVALLGIVLLRFLKSLRWLSTTANAFMFIAINVQLGLLPRSIFESRPPPRSTVARVETNVQLGLLPRSIFESRPPPQNTEARVETNAVVGPVTNTLLATATNDTRTAENNDLPLLVVLLPPKLPAKNILLLIIIMTKLDRASRHGN
jgi:hypothetical protein